MKKVIIVSGLHTTGDKGGMADLGKALREKGCDVRVYAYPSRWAFHIYSQRVRTRDALGLLHFCENDGSEVIISHSNGSLITQDATQLGLNVKGWISFGGAATSDGVAYPTDAFKWAISVFNPHDLALKLGSWLPFHPFGRLGSEGYRGAPDGSYDSRWRNVNGASSGIGLNHSHYTRKELPLWADFSYANILEGHSTLGIVR